MKAVITTTIKEEAIQGIAEAFQLTSKEQIKAFLLEVLRADNLTDDDLKIADVIVEIMD